MFVSADAEWSLLGVNVLAGRACSACIARLAGLQAAATPGWWGAPLDATVWLSWARIMRWAVGDPVVVELSPPQTTKGMELAGVRKRLHRQAAALYCDLRRTVALVERTAGDPFLLGRPLALGGSGWCRGRWTVSACPVVCWQAREGAWSRCGRGGLLCDQAEPLQACGRLAVTAAVVQPCGGRERGGVDQALNGLAGDGMRDARRCPWRGRFSLDRVTPFLATAAARTAR